MKKNIAIILCTLMLLPLMACGGGKEPAGPTPEPTIQPPVTDSPVQEPFSYDFNKDTLEYSDNYVSFTLPEGLNVFADNTSDYGGTYQCFFNFSNADPALKSNSVNYNAAVSAAQAGKTPLSAYTQEDMEKLFKEQFEQTFKTDILIETVSFNFDTLAGCPEITYEYTVTVSGTELNQIVVMIEKADVSLSIVYTFTGDDWDIYRSSVKTIMPRAE